MEDLKIIIDILKDTPDKIIWLVALYFAYKLIIVGGVYGVIKLFIKTMAGVLTKDPDKEIKAMEAAMLAERQAGKLKRVSKILIDEEAVDELVVLLEHIIKDNDSRYNYVHAIELRRVVAELSKPKDA